MNGTIAAAIVAVALLSTTAANAQVQPPQDRINTALARARQVGIPAALLESKIAEGKAKGVSIERIAAAIERRLGALERASQALRGGPADAAGTLAVSADAIESGVSEAVLRAVADNAPGEHRNVAIAALTELVRQGHTPEAALDRVRGALAKGPDALSSLPAEAASKSGSGGGSGGSGGAGSGGSSGSGRSDASRPGSSGKGGGSSGKGGGDPGPPAAVPAPGKPPQSGRPDNPGGNSGRPEDRGRPGDSGRPPDSGRGRR